jgi:hypothetical protein
MQEKILAFVDKLSADERGELLRFLRQTTQTGLNDAIAMYFSGGGLLNLDSTHVRITLDNKPCEMPITELLDHYPPASVKAR